MKTHKDRYGRVWVYVRDIGWLPTDWREDEQMPVVTAGPPRG